MGGGGGDAERCRRRRWRFPGEYVGGDGARKRFLPLPPEKRRCCSFGPGAGIDPRRAGKRRGHSRPPDGFDGVPLSAHDVTKRAELSLSRLLGARSGARPPQGMRFQFRVVAFPLKTRGVTRKDLIVVLRHEGFTGRPWADGNGRRGGRRPLGTRTQRPYWRRGRRGGGKKLDKAQPARPGPPRTRLVQCSEESWWVSDDGACFPPGSPREIAQGGSGGMTDRQGWAGPSTARHPRASLNSHSCWDDQPHDYGGALQDFLGRRCL